MIRGAGTSLAPGRNADQLQHGLQGQIDLLPQGRSVVAVFLRDANASHCRCATFPNVRSAEAFIEARLRIRGKQGFLAFWALAGGPDFDPGTKREQKPEVMAVIAETPELVQPFVFAGIESARAFVEYYTERRPHMPAPSICWAIPIRISTTGSGGVRLSPSSPPRIDGQAVAGESTELVGTVGEAGAYEEQHIDLWLSPPGRDNISEVRRVLAVKRWQANSKKSFSGFGSPAGRF